MMPFLALLSSTETISLYEVSAAALSEPARAVFSLRSEVRIKDVLARFTAVFRVVCRVRFSAEKWFAMPSVFLLIVLVLGAESPILRDFARTGNSGRPNSGNQGQFHASKSCHLHSL